MTETLDTGLTVAVFIDPLESAEAAGLRYVTDDAPGIRRQRRARASPTPIAQERTVKDTQGARAHPRSWPSRRPGRTSGSARRPNGHLQATGRDARGRKQYRYHPDWRAGARRDQVRPHDRLRRGPARASASGSTRDLGLRGLPREKVLAAVVRLLETTLIRVGNEEYARQNDSFGLTTLRDRARGDRRRQADASSSAARAARSTGRHPATGGWRASCKQLPGPARPGALPVPGRRAASATSVTSERRQRLPAGDRPARTSPPRTSAPGAAPCSPSRRSWSSVAVRDREGGQARPSWRPSSASRPSSATARRSAASSTSTPCSLQSLPGGLADRCPGADERPDLPEDDDPTGPAPPGGAGACPF